VEQLCEEEISLDGRKECLPPERFDLKKAVLDKGTVPEQSVSPSSGYSGI